MTILFSIFLTLEPLANVLISRNFHPTLLTVKLHIPFVLLYPSFLLSSTLSLWIYILNFSVCPFPNMSCLCYVCEQNFMWKVEKKKKLLSLNSIGSFTILRDQAQNGQYHIMLASATRKGSKSTLVEISHWQAYN